MKSAAPEAIRCLSGFCADVQSMIGEDPDVLNLKLDVPLIRQVIRQLQTCRHFLLPVGGAVMRKEFARTGVLPLSKFKLPASSLSIEFMVSEAGMLTDPGSRFSQPTFHRMALLQDLRDPALFATWERLLDPYPMLRGIIQPYQLMVLPINRMLIEDSGQHTWSQNWAAGLLTLNDRDGTYDEIPAEYGPMSRAHCEEQHLFFGSLGLMTAERIETDPEMNLERELSRDMNIEVMGAIDLGCSFGLGKANPRLYEAGGKNVWRAGSGPMMPVRLLG